MDEGGLTTDCAHDELVPLPDSDHCRLHVPKSNCALAVTYVVLPAKYYCIRVVYFYGYGLYCMLECAGQGAMGGTPPWCFAVCMGGRALLEFGVVQS
jgi:hypothetical protein